MNVLIRAMFTATICLSVAACAKNDPSASATDAPLGAPSATAAQQVEATQAPQAALSGVAGHVPIYTSHITHAPATMAPGIYAMETSDPMATVLAWYKARVSAPGVTWTTSGGADDGGTSFHFVANANNTTVQLDPDPRIGGGTAISVTDK